MWGWDGVRECGGVMVLGSSGSVGVGWCWGAVGVWGWDGAGEQWECGGGMVLGRSGSVGV